MHEWLIAEGIAKSVEGRKFKKIIVHVGGLQGIDKDILEFALRRMLNKDFEIVVEKPILRCRNCGKRWFPRNTGEKREEIHFLPELVFYYEKCPSCGSKDFEIERGRGVWVELLTQD